jgi:hypothetical protein
MCCVLKLVQHLAQDEACNFALSGIVVLFECFRAELNPETNQARRQNGGAASRTKEVFEDLFTSGQAEEPSDLQARRRTRRGCQFSVRAPAVRSSANAGHPEHAA